VSRPGVRIGVTLGDPRGIGVEVAVAALVDRPHLEHVSFRVFGWEGALPIELAERRDVELEPVGTWPSEAGDADATAGELAGRAIERAVGLALDGRIDGLVTGPISKAALVAAGYSFPGHTELLREQTGVPEVTMMMAAETTPLGGPLRMALLTAHIPLRDVPNALTPDLVERRSRIAERALREWWGLASPRLAFAGVNPHASEGGLFGDEEARVLAPAIERLEADGIRVSGIFPGDTVFGRCVEGEVDAVVIPYHDVGLAVIKTLARERGVNVTAGLPFPRTSPDHGTAFDIAGRGLAHAGSMKAAIHLCLMFAERGTRRLPEVAV
jgi:4-hydroxythreonine-4-phosphate dehydrogenase